MKASDARTDRTARAMEPVGKAALIASVGGARGYADWTNPDHRLRRLLAEFIGMAGLTFVLSGGAAILARYGGRALQPWQTVLVLSLVSERAVRPAGRRGLHHGLGHHGRALRRRLHEPGPQPGTRRGHRRPVHLVGLPDRTLVRLRLAVLASLRR